MRLSKEETVNKFIGSFLAGKTAEYAAKFRERPLDSQYISIMNWRRKNNGVETPATRGAVKVVNHLRRARNEMDRASGLTPAHIASVERELQSFQEYVADYRQNINNRRIAELELKRSELDRQIEALRGAAQNS